MQTLYELLGALPEDDADGLRAAFRKAVKASHPDNHPDDPDAPQRLRRIVRANTILSDEHQRATYDVLLAEARQERALDPEPRLFSETRYRFPGVVSSMVIASVSIGAFLLLEYVLANSVVAVQMQDLRAQASALTAPAPAPAPSSDTVGLADEHKRDRTSASNQPDAVAAAKEAVAPVALATADASVIPAAPEPVVKDATYYRERGSLAYRSGDLALALIDFDLAINLEPDVPDTYIDRAIVFRRMGNMTRALADIAKAKRIDDDARAVAPE